MSLDLDNLTTRRVRFEMREIEGLRERSLAQALSGPHPLRGRPSGSAGMGGGSATVSPKVRRAINHAG